MANPRTRFGLTLPNRGVIIGATTVDEMLTMAEWAESAGWDSVWVGDSILAKPRLDAIVLLGALAARTKRVRLGPACFASTPLRNPLILAYQWASLDFMSNGRTVFVACQGQPEAGGGAFEHEFKALRVEPQSRMRRMEEAIEIMRLTSSREHVDYDGKYSQFRDVTVLAAHAAADSNLGRVESQSHPAGQRRTRLSTRRPARRRLDDDRENAARASRLARNDSRLCPRDGPRVVAGLRGLRLSQHQRERRPRGGAGRVQALPRQLLLGELRPSVPRAMGHARLARRMRGEPARLHRRRRNHNHAPPDRLRPGGAVQTCDRGSAA